MSDGIVLFGFYYWNFGNVDFSFSRSQLIARDFTNVSVLLLAQCAACGRGDARKSICGVSNTCVVCMPAAAVGNSAFILFSVGQSKVAMC